MATASDRSSPDEAQAKTADALQEASLHERVVEQEHRIYPEAIRMAAARLAAE